MNAPGRVGTCIGDCGCASCFLFSSLCVLPSSAVFPDRTRVHCRRVGCCLSCGCRDGCHDYCCRGCYLLHDNGLPLLHRPPPIICLGCGSLAALPLPLDVSVFLAAEQGLTDRHDAFQNVRLRPAQRRCYPRHVDRRRPLVPRHIE